EMTQERAPVEVETKRLRGEISMGVLVSADPSWEVGRDVGAELGIVRAEPPELREGEEASCQRRA
ncbi:MAG: hypothetical protein WCQ44_02315, partial [Opitutaceae bacterium]